MLPQHRDEPLVGRVAVCLEQLIYLRFTLMSAHLTKSAVVTPTLALVCLSVLSAAISAEPLYIQPDQDAAFGQLVQKAGNCVKNHF